GERAHVRAHAEHLDRRVGRVTGGAPDLEARLVVAPVLPHEVDLRSRYRGRPEAHRARRLGGPLEGREDTAEELGRSRSGAEVVPGDADVAGRGVDGDVRDQALLGEDVGVHADGRAPGGAPVVREAEQDVARRGVEGQVLVDEVGAVAAAVPGELRG